MGHQKVDLEYLPLLLVLSAAVMALLLFIPSHSETMVGESYNSLSEIPSGFASPFTTNNHAFFSVSDVGSIAQGGDVSITIDADDEGTGSKMLFYRDFYVYRNDTDTHWKKYRFDEEPDLDGKWILDKASKTITLPADVLDEENWVLLFACERVNDAWKCGCRGNECNLWSIQSFAGPVFCEPDAGCEQKEDGDEYCSADKKILYACNLGEDGCLDRTSTNCNTSGNVCTTDGNKASCATCQQQAPAPDDITCGETDSGTLCSGTAYTVTGTQCNSGFTCDAGACKRVWYFDSDGDAFGNPAVSVLAEQQPNSYVANDGDCNDSDATINPNAIDECNGVDDNCDGSIDNGVNICSAGQSCISGSCHCSNECSSGSVGCDGSTPWYCGEANDGDSCYEKILGTPCTQTCDSSTGTCGCDSCSGSGRRCGSGTTSCQFIGGDCAYVQTCTNGCWQQSKTCDYGASCSSGSCTYSNCASRLADNGYEECTSDDSSKRCSGNVVQQCAQWSEDCYYWKDSTNCTKQGKSCDSSTFTCTDSFSDGDTSESDCTAASDQTSNSLGVGAGDQGIAWLPVADFETGLSPQCCGDDAGEYYLRQWPSGTGKACCNLEKDCVDDEGNCYTHNTKHTFSSGELFCYQNWWYQCQASLLCGAHKAGWTASTQECYYTAADGYKLGPYSTPPPEECGDGLDNDCDGQVDEGCPAVNLWISKVGWGGLAGEDSSRLYVGICATDGVDIHSLSNTAQVLFSSSKVNALVTHSFTDTSGNPIFFTEEIGSPCSHLVSLWTEPLSPNDYVTVKFLVDADDAISESDESDNAPLVVIPLNSEYLHSCGGHGEWPCDNANPGRGKFCYNTTLAACGASCNGANPYLHADGGCWFNP